MLMSCHLCLNFTGFYEKVEGPPWTIICQYSLILFCTWWYAFDLSRSFLVAIVGGGTAVKKQNSLVRCPCKKKFNNFFYLRVLINIGSSQSSHKKYFSQGISCVKQLSVYISDLLDTDNLLSY